MIYLWIGLAIYVCISLVLAGKWAIKKRALHKLRKENKETEERDPFFDKFYPHF
jgi:hypothetical protein